MHPRPRGERPAPRQAFAIGGVGPPVDAYPLGVYVADMSTRHDHQTASATDAHEDHDAHRGVGHVHGHQQADRQEQDADHDHAEHGHGEHAGHGGHAGHGDHVGQFRRLFWIMLVLAIPVVGFNDM